MATAEVGSETVAGAVIAACRGHVVNELPVPIGRELPAGGCHCSYPSQPLSRFLISAAHSMATAGISS